MQQTTQNFTTDHVPSRASLWPAKSLDRLAIRVLQRAIADAVSCARRGQVESKHLAWLWDTGRIWAEARGGADYKRLITNLCEEIEIMAYEIQAGREYIPTGHLGKLIGQRRRNKVRKMTNVT